MKFIRDIISAKRHSDLPGTGPVPGARSASEAGVGPATAAAIAAQVRSQTDPEATAPRGQAIAAALEAAARRNIFAEDEEDAETAREMPSAAAETALSGAIMSSAVQSASVQSVSVQSAAVQSGQPQSHLAGSKAGQDDAWAGYWKNADAKGNAALEDFLSDDIDADEVARDDVEDTQAAARTIPSVGGQGGDTRFVEAPRAVASTDDAQAENSLAGDLDRQADDLSGEGSLSHYGLADELHFAGAGSNRDLPQAMGRTQDTALPQPAPVTTAAQPDASSDSAARFDRLRSMEQPRKSIDIARVFGQPLRLTNDETRARAAALSLDQAAAPRGAQPVFASAPQPQPAPRAVAQPAPVRMPEPEHARGLDDMPFVNVVPSTAMGLPAGGAGFERRAEPVAARMADATLAGPYAEVAAGVAEGVEVPPPAAGRGSNRSGRVKTRLLGFNPESLGVANPFEKEASHAGDPFPVAWLVVVAGPGRGASFALHDGVSKIGRGEDQAVSLNFGDNAISRENHVAVAYDSESNAFFIGQSGKANIVRLNNKPLLSTEQLRLGDHVRIGETTLRFVPLCGDGFTWVQSA